MSRRAWPRDAICSSTSASRTKLRWKPIRAPSSFRFRPSIPQDIPDPQGKQVVFACRSGKRSVTASLAAQAAGLALRQASCGRHAGLEGCGIADQDRRLTASMTSMNKVFADLPVTIFEAMSQLARDNNAINLGQGFPDDPGPEDIRRAAADAVDGRLQPIPVDDGHSGTAAGDRGPLRALARPHPRSHDRGDGDLGRHRGADVARFLPWSSPATRSSCSSRSTIPICRSSARPAAFRAWCASNRRIGG